MTPESPPEFDPDNFDLWREEEDLPRLQLIGRALTAPTVHVQAFPGMPPDELFHYVYFSAPEVDEYPLFACVVAPGQDVAVYLERWIVHLFPGVPLPRIEVVFPPC